MALSRFFAFGRRRDKARRLVLHVGYPKTGTTTIQHVLESNRRWLARQGVTYAAFADCGASHNRYALRLGEASDADLPALRREIAEQGAPGTTLVVSAEDFSLRIPGDQSRYGFDRPDYRERRADYVDRLVEVTRDFDEIDVVACFRRPEDYAESLYVTLLNSAWIDCDFPTFVATSMAIFDYRDALALLRGRFARVRPIAFERIKPDLVRHFVEHAGLPCPPDIEVTAKVMPDARTALWIRHHLLAEGETPVQRLRSRFVRKGDGGALLPPTGRVTLWPSEAAIESFLAGTTEPEPGFFGPRRQAPVVPAVLTPEDHERLEAGFAAWRARRPGRES